MGFGPSFVGEFEAVPVHEAPGDHAIASSELASEDGGGGDSVASRKVILVGSLPPPLTGQTIAFQMAW